VAEFANNFWIGNHSVAIDGWPDIEEDSAYDRLKSYDSVLGAAHADMHARPASFYQIDLYILTTANNNAKDSCDISAPWPLRILAADVGCETCAADAGTLDILVDPDGGTTYASILDAAQDVKTGAGVGQRVAPEDGEEEIPYDAAMKIRQTATTAAAMVGGQAHLYVQRM
jgi:hypothetical protein